MKKETSINKIETLTVDIPPFTSNVGRLIGVIFGLVITLISSIMIVSLVLFIPGMFGALTGLFLIVICAPKADVNCPACNTDNKVILASKQLKCEGCDTSTPLRWNNKKK